MAFFADNFTGTDGTTLQAHAPDTGTSWTRLWGTNAANDLEINGNACRPDANAGDAGLIYTADATYPSANYDITWTQVSLSTLLTHPFYAFVRIQDQENMYAVRLMTGTTACQLYKKVSGSWSALGSAFDEPVDGSVCKLEINGTTLKFFDDGVQVASATVSDISAAGKAGIGAGGGAELITSTEDLRTGHKIDSLTINDLGGGASYTLTAAAGAYSQSGVTTTLLFKHIITAALGTYSQTGVTASLLRKYTLAPALGSYALSGVAITNPRMYILGSATGSYVLSGVNVNTLRDRTIIAGVGSYALTGISNTFLYARLMGTSVGNYALTGVSNNLLFKRLLSVAVGAHALSGNTVTLIFSGGAISYTMSANVGVYAISGQAANLAHGRILNAALGTYSVSGVSSGFVIGRKLIADLGTYSLLGTGPQILSSRRIAMGVGLYSLNGVNVSLYIPSGISHYVYIIPIENRVFVIPVEVSETITDRTFAIPIESRMYEVAHD